MAKYKVIRGIMEGLEFNGSPVKIDGESRIWNDDSTGQSFKAENCTIIESDHRISIRNPYNGNSHNVFLPDYESGIPVWESACNRGLYAVWVYSPRCFTIAETVKHSKFESVFCSGGDAESARLYAEGITEYPHDKVND